MVAAGGISSNKTEKRAGESVEWYSSTQHTELVRHLAAFLWDKVALTKTKQTYIEERNAELNAAQAEEFTFDKTDMGQMASGQPFNSSAFIRSPRPSL